MAIDGDTIVVGARDEDSDAVDANGNQFNNNALDSGAVYVFTRDGNDWHQQAYLKASNTESNDGFGNTVAIDDDTIVIGAKNEDSNAIRINGDQSNNDAAFSGAVYVFTRDDTIWNQQAYLKASNSDAGDAFGHSVAVSGNTLVVSTRREGSNAIGVNGDETNNLLPGAGAAYVFIRNETSWEQQAYLKPADTGGASYFGSSASISKDLITIGGEGGVYVYYRTGINWAQIDKLKVSATSAAVSGELIVAGQPFDGSKATVHQLDNIEFDPVILGNISGYVWLDTDADGLQDSDEPAYSETLFVALHQNLSFGGDFNTEPIEIVTTDENGRYIFENFLSGGLPYHICISTEYVLQGLSITTRNAGDDSIDNDFDGSSCTFAFVDLSERIDAVYDLGLIGGPIKPDQPIQSTLLTQPIQLQAIRSMALSGWTTTVMVCKTLENPV